MIRLFERGEPADAITVTETLRREGVFEEVGGHTVLATLQRGGHGRHAVHRLHRDRAGEGAPPRDDPRRPRDRGAGLRARRTTSRPSWTAPSRCSSASPQRRFQQQRLPGPRDPGPGDPAHRDALPPQGRHHRAGHGVPRSWTSARPGLQRADFVIIAGRPSTGKTAFALNIAAARRRRAPAARSLIFSLEMSKYQLARACSDRVRRRLYPAERPGGQLNQNELARLISNASGQPVR